MSLKTYSLNDETKTNLIAHNDNDNTNLDAKVQQKCNTAKSDVNNSSFASSEVKGVKGVIAPYGR